MNAEATGASAAIMFFRSLSAMAANTIGSGSLPVSCRYDASAAAPAGLCAASISSSPRRAAAAIRGAPATRMGQAGDDRRRSGRGRRIADQRSRIATAIAAFSSWCRPASASVSGGYRAIRACRVRIDDRRADFASDLAIRPPPPPAAGRSTSGTPGLAMPAFSNAIVRQRAAEMTLVIEGDRRDGGDRRRQHVGRIEAAAEADLDDRHVDRRPPEDLERHRGRDLEERRRHRESRRCAVAAQSTRRPRTSRRDALRTSPRSTGSPSIATRSSMRSRCGEV